MSRVAPASYWILCALADGEAHGYVIAQRIRELADGEVGVGTGTLYAAIERLRAAGLIELAAETRVEGRIRRSYRLTGSGKDVVVTETERRAAAVSRASRQLGLAT